MTTPATELEKALKKGVIFPSEIAKYYQTAGYGAKKTATSINAVFNSNVVNYNDINKVFDSISKKQESIATPTASVNEKKTTALNSIVATSLAQQISKDLPKDTIAIWTASSSANPSLSHMAYYGREFVLSEGINGELPGERPNCQCGFIIKNLPKDTATIENTGIEVKEAPKTTIKQAKAEKMTKTEIAKASEVVVDLADKDLQAIFWDSHNSVKTWSDTASQAYYGKSHFSFDQATERLELAKRERLWVANQLVERKIDMGKFNDFVSRTATATPELLPKKPDFEAFFKAQADKLPEAKQKKYELEKYIKARKKEEKRKRDAM